VKLTSKLPLAITALSFKEGIFGQLKAVLDYFEEKQNYVLSVREAKHTGNKIIDLQYLSFDFSLSLFTTFPDLKLYLP
jgi:hypothetical protein